MTRSLGIPALLLSSILLPLGSSFATSRVEPEQIAPAESPGDLVVDETGLVPVRKALIDTIWIADWSFDHPGGGCTDDGWVKIDGRIVNDGSNYWVIDNRFNGIGPISGKAAILSRHNLCWECNGYGNNWDYSIIVKYKGAGSTLSFGFLSDTEPSYDFITVEADSAGASEARVDYAVDPAGTPEAFRSELLVVDGVQSTTVSSLPLPIFGVPGTTHEVYIRLESDGAYSAEECLYPSAWNAGLVVDNLVITGGLSYTETFEGALNSNVTLVNSASATGFLDAPWARLFPHITDNDKCTENTTCAWLWTDPTLISYFPDMGFGPGQAVVSNWLDDIIVSPWVSLASTPGATGTSLRFRRFAGNRFNQGSIVQGWRVRGKVRQDNTDTGTLGDSIDCVSTWGHASSFNSLGSFSWADAIDGSTARPFDMTTHFDPSSTEIQVSFRVTDWQLIADPTPPPTLNPGPGPYVDRVRIGRRIVTGPTINIGIDNRTQAQDCFPTVQNGIVPGEHFSPDAANRFGTCAFSEGTELGIGSGGSANLITGDSIQLQNVVDARNAGGVTSVRWYGAIVSGPHAGKAPAPYTVGGNGFFAVNADSCRASSGQLIAGAWFVDLDDTYFRGGDVLLYFWAATDAGGGFTSAPEGLTTLPASVTAAELATNGLSEVSYLPTINWAPAYLARIAAHASGDLDPTPAELAASTQKSCILYNQHTTSARRSGQTQRTAFMYTLDRLGFRGYYDVYDHSGYGNTNNQLGGRANVAQASGYALIIEDDGRSGLVPNIPDGSNGNEKVNQAQWYRNYLAQGLSGLAGTATLWIIGENTAFEKQTNPLLTADVGLTGIVTDQGLSVNPDVEGVAAFTWASGSNTSFVGDKFSLNGGCPTIRAYDAANAAGTATRTHSYKVGATSGGGAIVMNKNSTLQWNTVWQGFAWGDMHYAGGSTPGSPDEQAVLAMKVLARALPVNCVHGEPTGVGDPETDVPPVSALHQNVPNPFNPTTTIRFDLSRTGHVLLVVFDVAGHKVKTLANSRFEAGRNIPVIWNGLDEDGRRVTSGVYFYRLEAAEFTATRKLVVLK